MMNQSNILYYITILLIGFLGLRVTQLQILEHDRYKVLAKNNTTRSSITRAPRGIIYDRDGDILATSKQSLSVVVFPAELRKKKIKKSVAKTLANFVEANEEELLAIFMKMDPSTPLPITLDNDVDISVAIKIFENQKYLPGISVEKQATRYYPYHEAAAHLLGYVGQINNKELKQGRSRGLGLGDIVGKEGLEKVFDAKLQGTKGEQRVVVDRYGRSMLGNSPEKKIIQEAVKGEDLHLTIDIDVQKAAYEAMKDLQGAAVVLNPKNGEIYALVSTPSYDPNIFTKPIASKTFNQLMQKKAFLNRALSSYTPGSIWKPFTALTALEHGNASRSEKLAVSGNIDFGGFSFGDWTTDEKAMNIVEALAWSRNTFFYQIAKRMKPETIANAGRAFGAGKKTGVELLGESSGIVPDPEWKKKNLKEAWFPGNTLHLSIGQSFLMVSPIQAARMISGLANQGHIPEPHLVKNPAKEKLQPVEAFSSQSYAIVLEGLKRCVASGTGGASRLKGIKVAGKTGSAEVKGYAHSTHSWFAAFAPVEDPEIALAVFGEGAGHGGSVSAPIAKKIFEEYFNSASLRATNPVIARRGIASTKQSR